MLKTLDMKKSSVGSVGKILTEEAVDLDVDKFLAVDVDELLEKELFAEDVVTLDVEKILTEEEVDAVIVLQPEVFLILHVATDFKLPQDFMLPQILSELFSSLCGTLGFLRKAPMWSKRRSRSLQGGEQLCFLKRRCLFFFFRFDHPCNLTVTAIKIAFPEMRSEVSTADHVQLLNLTIH